MQIDGSVVLVTGGASGLGEGAVRFLAARGAKVAILDLPRSAGSALAGQLGDAAAFFGCDVTDPAMVESAVKAVADRFGRLDVSINCAGAGPGARMLDREGNPHPLDLYRKIVELDLIGLFDVNRWSASLMARNEPGESGERGLIVNTASIAGYEGQVGQAAYSAAKGGVIAMTLPMARDLAASGIRVMTICPGIMDTPAFGDVDDALKQKLADIHVFPKRLGTPEDFGRLAASFLENTLLNGEVVRLDAATRLGPR
ncbi:SDR family NAD(P)-dependent oxidoreductase [Gordonia rubripertincta]|uniref:SDR family NAD(P)-dependent oxidoreductase n=1 Tax=Gordonia rubripertincta TaxID=36822 RepID=A0ABT4MWN8_GORRU|nr:SDR family NAD(P)-dependent oxidoreductase [Gordonia rubripertincta]MCZ4551430.1 SDR family NAD(P)-dependent oxidoreductase [Gordonia rubripertincta]